MLIRKTSHFFSIVLPLYKPKGDWVNLFIRNVTELEAILPEDIHVSYIVVHDGPTTFEIDDSFQYISQTLSNVSFVYYKENMGKGYALRQGVNLANTDYVLITDFDFPYKKKNIVELIRLLKEGHDIVMGKRSRSYFKQLPFRRKIISGFCFLLKKIFLDLPFYDTQSGIKAFNQTGKKIFLETTINRFLADTEFILRSHKQNLSIKEMDIELEAYVEFSNFGFSVIKTEMSNFLKLLHLNKKLGKSPV